MTNREKFKETFGFDLDRVNLSMCPVAEKICKQQGICKVCPFQYFWEREYKPCFKMREDLDG